MTQNVSVTAVVEAVVTAFEAGRNVADGQLGDMADEDPETRQRAEDARPCMVSLMDVMRQTLADKLGDAGADLDAALRPLTAGA